MSVLNILLGTLVLVFQYQLVSANQDKWSALNATVHGRLFRNQPFSRACFSTYNGQPVQVDETGCSAIRNNYTSIIFRHDIPGAYQNTDSETCLSYPEDQCLLDNSMSPADFPTANSTCNQGSVSDYYIDVREPADIVAGFQFSKTYGIPVFIKNSGHDFMMRSTQKGSLLLWVHNLRGLTHYDTFTPDGCKDSVGRAITVATGESTQRAFEFASEHGSMILGGYSPTIALSGGYVLGGGHSVLAPVYGMAADRVAEFKIVTPDGMLRTANSCQNPDLFRALRGGGGGTFGVVLEATHRAEAATPVAIASIALPSNATAETSVKWIELQARESLRWGQEGWGGHVAGLYLKHMNPLPNIANMSDGAAAAAESMRVATEFALSAGGSSIVEVLPDYLALWNKYVVPGALQSAGVGLFLSGRLVPREVFAREEGIGKMMNYISRMADLGFDPRTLYVPVGSPYVANTTIGKPITDVNHGDQGTSFTPTWYDALWEVGYGNSIPWNSTYAERLHIITMMAQANNLMEDVTGPHSGAYYNEANPFSEDWREAFWGSNYDFLVATKKKYDPDSILKCWKCIGFGEEDIASEEFRCIGKLQQSVSASTQ